MKRPHWGNCVGKKSYSIKLLSVARFFSYITWKFNVLTQQPSFEAFIHLFFLKKYNERKRERDHIGIFIFKLEWKNTCVPQCVTPYNVLVHESRKACLMSYSNFFLSLFLWLISHSYAFVKRELTDLKIDSILN